MVIFEIIKVKLNYCKLHIIVVLYGSSFRGARYEGVKNLAKFVT